MTRKMLVVTVTVRETGRKDEFTGSVDLDYEHVMHEDHDLLDTLERQIAYLLAGFPGWLDQSEGESE